MKKLLGPPPESPFRVKLESAGWRYVTDSDEVERICGDRDGIVHVATVFGDASYNDSVYATWEACFAENPQ